MGGVEGSKEHERHAWQKSLLSSNGNYEDSGGCQDAARELWRNGEGDVSRETGKRWNDWWWGEKVGGERWRWNGGVDTADQPNPSTWHDAFDWSLHRRSHAVAEHRDKKKRASQLPLTAIPLLPAGGHSEKEGQKKEVKRNTERAWEEKLVQTASRRGSNILCWVTRPESGMYSRPEPKNTCQPLDQAVM